MRAGRAPEAALRGGPQGAGRGQAEVGHVIVRYIGITFVILGYKAGVFVNYIDPRLGGGINQIPSGILDYPAAQAGTHVNVGIYLRGGVAEGAEPVGWQHLSGLAVPFIESHAFPGDNPKAAFTVFQKIGNPVGAVKAFRRRWPLLPGGRAAQALLMHPAVLPYFPPRVVPQAHIDRSAAVLVEARYAILGQADPEFPVPVFHQGGNLPVGNAADLLQGGAEDGQPVVATHPEVALPVFEYAV